MVNDVTLITDWKPDDTSTSEDKAVARGELGFKIIYLIQILIELPT